MFRNPITWLFLLIVLVLAIAVWTTVARLPRPRQPITSSPPALGPTKSPSEVTIFSSDPVLGQADAEVIIIEFGDFECPYCAQVATTLEKVMNDNPGKIKLIWKDFPLPSHSQAQGAAEAAQCAARQGKFWQYHDALFQNQGNLGETTYLSLVGQVGLDFASFSQCLQSRATLPLIERNVAEATSIGVDGTPYFIINGQPISGLLTEEQFTALVE